MKTIEQILPEKALQEFNFLRQKNKPSSIQMAHFLAQISYESGRYRHRYENLNYSAAALKRVFGKYFPGDLANAYARKPERIANRVYANRMGNGDVASGDGWNYRGRGFLQLTGKNNYEAFGEYIGEDCVAMPDLVAEKYPMRSAFWFFSKNGLWRLAQNGCSYNDVKRITRRVNGGYHGLSSRWEKFKYYHAIL